MSARQKAFAIAVALALILAIFELIRRRKLREEYALVWLLVGFGIGSWDATTSTCGPLLAWNNSATPGTIIIGNALAGNFCVQVYDVGTLAAGAQTNYTLTATHY